MTMGDISTRYSPVDRSSKTKLNRETKDLNDTSVQMDLTDIYRVFHSKAAEYTLFLRAYGSPGLITC